MTTYTLTVSTDDRAEYGEILKALAPWVVPPKGDPGTLPRVSEIAGSAEDIAWVRKLSDALNSQVPVTIEDDDYPPLDLGEHPPIYQDITQGATA